MDQLPHIDVVVVSHNHFDHLDRNSALLLAAQAGGPPLFLVPLGIKPWFSQLGIDHVVELDWWQSHAVAGTEFFLTPVQHWSGRSLTDRHHALWGGWAVFAPAFQWYFPVIPATARILCGPASISPTASGTADSIWH